MAADRGAFIDQSQSLNVHIASPNFGKLTSMHFYAWKLGLKTGMYYLRTKAAASAIQFTVDKTRLAKNTAAAKEGEEEKVRRDAWLMCVTLVSLTKVFCVWYSVSPISRYLCKTNVFPKSVKCLPSPPPLQHANPP